MQKRPLLVCDWDCTLAEPTQRSFYAAHRTKTEQAIATHFDLTPQALHEVLRELDDQEIRIEKLFSKPDLASTFNLAVADKNIAPYQHVYDALESITPDDWFSENKAVVDAIRSLQAKTDIVILSNSPAGLIRSIGEKIGFDMDRDFQRIYAQTPEMGAPKFVDAQAAFERVVSDYNPDLSRSWSIGDGAHTDLIPAAKLGFNTGLVDNLGTAEPNQPYTVTGPIQKVLSHITLAI